MSRGIHPPQHKYTAPMPIVTAPVPKRVVLPLLQHVGAMATPIVSVGDEVKTGQIIGEAQGRISAPVHASITGRVTNIMPHLIPSGDTVLSVMIEGDGNDEWVAHEISYSDFYRYHAEDLVAVVKQNGIVGLGGAGLPAHVKLSPHHSMSIDTVIANGAECEPYLTSDHRFMLEHTRDIVMGLSIAMHILNADHGIIAVEDNKPDAIFALQHELARHPNMDVVIVPTRYPTGAEGELIHAVVKRTVPAGMLPMDVGCVVHNVATLCAIKEAVYKSKPLIERVITVSGMHLNRTNLRVRIGISFRDVLALCKWDGIAEVVIAGGPMTGVAQSSLDVPVIKTTTGILAFDTVMQNSTQTCISCGRCIRVCPVNLMPNLIHAYTEQEAWNTMGNLHVDDCIECGSCAYECPAKLPLVHSVRWAKKERNAKCIMHNA